MIFVYYFFAAVLIWLSCKSFIGGIRYLKYFCEELAKPWSNFTPFVSVIAPFKGVDDDLEKNLAAIVDQDYSSYEILFVVDDESDPSVSEIRKALARRDAETRRTETALLSFSFSASPRLCGKLIIAPRSIDSSQKVENLREAVLHASPESQIFVFVDSDARVSKDWLRALVAPLEDKQVGATTGYRWFISKKPTFATEMISAWNASIASAVGPNRKSNFCWGGSTAIRRETFERLKIREKWNGVVSDDFVLADAVKDGGLEIVFVPQALTASFITSDPGGMLEFTNRQMKLTRVYATKLWLMTLFGTGLFNGVILLALAIVIFSPVNNLQVWVSIAVLGLVTVFSVGKAWLRLAAVRLALPQFEQLLRRQMWTQNTLWSLTGALFFINSNAALFSRHITWRGITYRLKSPTETVIISGK